MQKLNRRSAKVSKPYPEKVLQFGGGNFLRAFVDWMMDVYNDQTDAELGILVATSTERAAYHAWQNQEGLYHVITRGYQDGNIVDGVHLVKSVSRILNLTVDWEAFLASAENPDLRFIISNTTEAGIQFNSKDQQADQPPFAFPAKLTLWLYHRYQYFEGNPNLGCIFLPTELILENGAILRKCILQNIKNWNLEAGFRSWIEDHNTFCNTLVDRIVPGVAKEALSTEQQQIGFQDALITQGEAFHFWAIQGPGFVQKELPLDKAGLQVIFTNDLTPYRTQKVRILNGAHTSMVPVGYLYGIKTVREAVEDKVLGAFIAQVIFKEIIPTLDLPETELNQYANSILDRFKNPFIEHQLISISLNSISKFKTRVLPSMIEFHARKGQFPDGLVFAMAALIHFYRGNWNGEKISLKDAPQVTDFLQSLWGNYKGTKASMRELALQVLAWDNAWEIDLSVYEGLQEKLSTYLMDIEQRGIGKAISGVL
ncbi:MAG: tagaturonate reductase [Saprospiraceae bacterium]